MHTVDEPADRLELARAVRRVGNARGHSDTRRALLELAARAEEWADKLAETGEDHDHRNRAA